MAYIVHVERFGYEAKLENRANSAGKPIFGSVTDGTVFTRAMESASAQHGLDGWPLSTPVNAPDNSPSKLLGAAAPSGRHIERCRGAASRKQLVIHSAMLAPWKNDVTNQCIGWP